MFEDNKTREILSKIRSLQEGKELSDKSLLTEEEGKSKKAIAITDDPKFGQNALSNQIDQFKASVESGAQFSKPEEGKVESAPLIYLPETGNLIFSGIIPCLNNLKWQFVLKTNTGNGCFIWSDGLVLSDENLKILNKLYGFYKNWRESWFSDYGDLERLGQMFKED